MSRPLANNFTALAHASGATILAGLYLCGNGALWGPLVDFSTGYFLYDFLQILMHGKRNRTNAAYLYHHLASIYIIGQDPEIYRGGEILFWGELSNLPMYYVYYLIKTNNQSKVLFWKKTQAIVYSCIRLPVLGWLGYKTIPNVADKTPFYVVTPVYFLGMYWSLHLWRKLLKR